MALLDRELYALFGSIGAGIAVRSDSLLVLVPNATPVQFLYVTFKKITLSNKYVEEMVKSTSFWYSTTDFIDWVHIHCAITRLMFKYECWIAYERQVTIINEGFTVKFFHQMERMQLSQHSAIQCFISGWSTKAWSVKDILPPVLL